MSDFLEISPEQLAGNPFRKIGSDWMLVTAGDRQHLNTMTASWGTLGVMWNLPVAQIVVRPQRYTREFIDSAQAFSLSFLSERYRRQLSYLGTASGRDGDKIHHSGLTTATADGIPYVAEADQVLFCRVLYRQLMNPACFIKPETIKPFYPERDYHIAYTAQIIKVFERPAAAIWT